MTKEEERLRRLKTIVAALPSSPGCYQYLDEDGRIIYVGKAKNLKSRVSSYFRKTVDRRKTEVLVSKIQDIKYIVVPTDEDALLLENNLIKKYKPRYNILLKDGKTYPSVCVTNEYLPRVFKTRHIQKKGGTYFGPFSHLGTLNNILELIKKMYSIRRCNKPITQEGVEAGKYQTCLEYHIKNCKAPCTALQTREEYMKEVEEVKEILRGNTRILCQKMLAEMEMLADEMRFEEAMVIKRRYDLALEYCEKSEVVAHSYHNIDVFSIDDEEKSCFINYLHVTNGSINQAFTFEYKKRIDESAEDMLALGIAEMRERYKSTSKEIVIPFPIDLELEGITFTIPERGDKKHLLELSKMNVRQYRIDSLKQAERLNPEQRSTNILKELQRKLGLEKLPMRIECFDNSNISGSDAVAGCIVYKHAKPARSEYRKFNIKTVVGPDDYGSMKEVVYRKYRRAIDENTELPDLIICDGGKGQMEVVREVIQDELHIDIPIAGLAKDNRHRTNELLFGFPQKTIGVEMDSPLFKFLTRIQDEVHRFAITFHREKRSKSQTKSELDSIKGIGPASKKLLLKEFKSLKRIKEASTEDLAKVVGAAKAQLLADAFKTTLQITNILQ
ncbi:MAG: excinuclease ABC subunit UvrC [Bacteroidaceae bacterium]|nr:excinuclease ABC subunit UvrC [Bacteroidaceae bacterium]